MDSFFVSQMFNSIVQALWYSNYEEFWGCDFNDQGMDHDLIDWLGDADLSFEVVSPDPNSH
jgi:hypothetical protein